MYMQSFQFLLQGRVVMLILLAVAVLLSGMAVSLVKYESRKLFTEMERLRVQRDELAVDWSRLQIELATWAEQGRVKESATTRLDMQVPQVADMMVIKH